MWSNANVLRVKTISKFCAEYLIFKDLTIFFFTAYGLIYKVETWLKGAHYLYKHMGKISAS